MEEMPTKEEMVRRIVDMLMPAVPSVTNLSPRTPAVRLPKKPSGKPVTADCYGAHCNSWCGGATPRRPGAE